MFACALFGLLCACTLGPDSGLAGTYYYSYHPSWKAVGGLNVSGGSVGDMSLVTGPGGAAFVVYQDWGPAKATALQLTGNTWSLLGGAGFSAGGISTPSAAYDFSGTPYVAFQDSANGNAASVMWFNTPTWVPLGTPGFSAGTATDTSLAIDSGSIPYVAYSDGGASPVGAASVRKFSAGSWVLVGTRGFSAGTLGVGNTSLAIDSAGTLYVAYVDGNTGNNVTAMMFNGSSWVLVGPTPGFGPGSGSGNTSLAINPTTQDPWVAFSDSGSGRAMVMKYHGGWTVAGNADFSVGAVTGMSLKFDSIGNAYAAFSDAGLSGKAVVYQFNGSSWKRVGGSVSPGIAGSIAFSVDSLDVPLCAFRDDSGSFNASVKRYR